MSRSTNTMRRLITDDDIPMTQVKSLRDRLGWVKQYLMDNSLGSLDERILLNDTVACLIALSALDFRTDEGIEDDLHRNRGQKNARTNPTSNVRSG